MIQTIELNCGETPQAKPLILDGSKGVTIFVGPNNSGKSALLEALYGNFNHRFGKRQPALKKLTFRHFDINSLEERIEFRGKSDDASVEISGISRTRRDWISGFRDKREWLGQTGKLLREGACIWLNGTTRLATLGEESGGNLTNPSRPLERLLTDDPRRKNFQSAVFEGIGRYPFIDRITSNGTLKLAFSEKKPDAVTERGVDNNLLEYVKSSLDRASVSDGFNAYVGIIGTLFASDYRCILIDEPEAFLHPALARTLGKQIAVLAKDKQVFAATHSAEFLMGAIESGVPIRIVRLQYEKSVASACLLDGAELKTFMNDPLLRSANVLSGLFARSVIVGESDTDRAFYQEINTRLLSERDQRGIENAVFLNAQNKQTVTRIMRLLRKMGVPTVGIVDLDVFSEGGENWSKQMDAAGIPQEMRSTLEVSRKSIFECLKAASTDREKKDFKRRGGIALLEKGSKEAAENVIDNLKNYGLIIVPCGEIEGWLAKLHVSRSKNNWLHCIFDALGSNADKPEYVRPSEGDVWDFIGLANSWLTSPDRKGMATANG